MKIKIDIDKVKSIEDIKTILRCMNLHYITELNPKAFNEISHLLVDDYDIEVLSYQGRDFESSTTFATREKGDIEKGCWAVVNGKLIEVDAYFLHTNKNKNVVRVKKPDWI